MNPYYYIYRVGGNAPKVKHNTLEEAEREALRLAQQHPESTFEILRCVGISRMTKPSVFWMDGIFPSDIEEPKYRDLEKGEMIISKVDEFFDPCQQKWLKYDKPRVDNYIYNEVIHKKHRRRINYENRNANNNHNQDRGTRI